MRYATRLLRRQPRYSLVAILTMALGIGLTTVSFSVAYGVSMEPLPWPEADRIVVLQETRGGNPPRFNAFSNAAYLAWHKEAATIDEIAAWSQSTVTLAGAGEAERIRVIAASASLFRALGAGPLIGSLLDARDNDSPSIVLSEGLWRRRFHGNRGALGRLVQLDGQAHTIVGVLPDALAFPDRQAQAWIPYRIRPATNNSLAMFNAIARLKPGVTAAQAASEGTARGRFAADTAMTTMAIFGSTGPIAISARPLHDAVTADVRRPLMVLLAAAGLLLVTAMANVAGLQMARATTRGREMAIRAALGAGRARVTRQLLAESFMLGLAGGGAGLALAWLMHRLIPDVLPAEFPRVDALHITVPVMLFTLLVSLATSIVFGLLPDARARRVNLVESLARDGGAPIGSGLRSRTGRARATIMAGQIAIACVLLVGASLLGRSFIALLTVDRGYDPAGVLTARLALPGSMYTAERRYALLDQVLDRLVSIPGVTAVGFTSELPLTPGCSTSAFTIRSAHVAPFSRPNGVDQATISVQASPRIVSPRTFPALGMRIIAGRGFADSDSQAAPPVVIVNRAFAGRYLGDSPLGAQLPMGVGYQDVTRQATVIGVVDDVRYPTAATSSLPEIYFSYRQMTGRLTVSVVTLLVRAEGEPADRAAALRGVARDVDVTLVPDVILPMEERVLRTLARPRLYAILLSGFAVFSLVVAGVGLFGVLSYTVAQRSRELAVRVALGARRSDIVRLVLRQGLAVTVAGVVAGLLASLLLTRAIATLLYGVSTRDGVTYLVVPAILVVIAAAACLEPARRAARLDPMRSLGSQPDTR